MNRKINVYLLCTIAFFQGLVFYGPVATLFRQSRGLSMYNIFIIESVYMVLSLIFEVPWGYFADRFGYKKTLIISNLLFFISKIVFFEAHSFSMFLFERILLALSISGLSGCDVALLYSSIEEDKSEKAFGIYNAASSAGFFFASLLASVMLTKSMDLTASATIIPYAIAAALTFFLKDAEHSKEERISLNTSIKALLGNKKIFIIILAFTLINEASHSVTVFFNQPQYLKSGIDIKFLGLITALVQLASMASVKTHKITEKFGQSKAMITFLFLVSLSCFMLALTNNPFLSVALVILVGGSFSIINPIVLDIENKSVITQNRATMLSTYAMAGDMISVVINPVIGKLADISLETAFFTCASASIIAFILAFVYFRL